MFGAEPGEIKTEADDTRPFDPREFNSIFEAHITFFQPLRR